MCLYTFLPEMPESCDLLATLAVAIVLVVYTIIDISCQILYYIESYVLYAALYLVVMVTTMLTANLI